jgi:hypothetical protein
MESSLLSVREPELLSLTRLDYYLLYKTKFLVSLNENSNVSYCEKEGITLARKPPC